MTPHASFGVKNPKAKLTDTLVLTLRYIKAREPNITLHELKKRTRCDVGLSAISKAIVGDTWPHIGGRLARKRDWNRRDKWDESDKLYVEFMAEYGKGVGNDSQGRSRDSRSQRAGRCTDLSGSGETSQVLRD